MPKQVTNVAADDALTTIYRLSNDEGEEVIAARVAERLDIRPASVAGMLSRLSRDHLVDIDKKKRVTLTKKGFERAKLVVRRHRLAECMLVDVMGLDWVDAYQEAHLMEHAISDVTEPLIVKLLGNPTLSPFGYPIPGSFTNESLSMLRLSELDEGQYGKIDRVFEEDEELLRFYDEVNLKPGSTVNVVNVARVRGEVDSITIIVNKGTEPTLLGPKRASNIWMVRLP